MWSCPRSDVFAGLISEISAARYFHALGCSIGACGLISVIVTVASAGKGNRCTMSLDGPPTTNDLAISFCVTRHD